MPSLRHSSSYACSAVDSAFLAPSNTDSFTPAGKHRASGQGQGRLRRGHWGPVRAVAAPGESPATSGRRTMHLTECAEGRPAHCCTPLEGAGNPPSSPAAGRSQQSRAHRAEPGRRLLPHPTKPPARLCSPLLGRFLRALGTKPRYRPARPSSLRIVRAATWKATERPACAQDEGGRSVLAGVQEGGAGKTSDTLAGTQLPVSVACRLCTALLAVHWPLPLAPAPCPPTCSWMWRRIVSSG